MTDPTASHLYVHDLGKFTALTVITIVIFGAASLFPLLAGWKLRHRRGYVEISKRRAAWFAAAFLALAPLAFMASLWISVPGSPLYMGVGSMETTTANLMFVVIAATFVGTVVCLVLMWLAIRQDAAERKAMSDLEPPDGDN